MKKIVSVFATSAALVCALVFSSSCKKNDPVTPVVITFDCYTAGNESGEAGVTTAVIYQDSKELYRLPEGSYVTGVAYVGGDLYSCGSMNNNLAFWKNDKMANGSAVPGAFTDMVGDGTNWYCCGNIFSNVDSYGVIYKNGSEVYKSTEPSCFLAMDLGSSGDWYVVGTVGEEVRVLRISAETGTVKDSYLISSDLRYVPTDMYVGLRDICVSLNYRTVETDYAYCWLSAEPEVIKLSNKTSHAYSAALFNGNFFIGGDMINTAGNQFAVQWVNGIPEDFSYGCKPEYSSVKLLKNTGYSLFEAVESPGMVQICSNGGEVAEISCANSFQVSAWDVVRK